MVSEKGVSVHQAAQINLPETGRPRCRACRHHYITHNINVPYGCRELGFISAREPMRDVIEASGQTCLYFAPMDRVGRAQ